MNTNKGIFKTVNRWLVAALLLTGSSTLLAAPLNLDLLTPDINVPFMSTNYDAGTDVFTADATFGGLTLDGASITDGIFSLTANISAGGILNTGSLTIDGTIGSYISGTLLTGDLTLLGFANDSSQTLEFVFDVTGGDLAPEYDSGIGGIIMAFSGYNENNFNTSFNASSAADADIAPIVPVPAALWLFGSGLLGLVHVARRRS